MAETLQFEPQLRLTKNGIYIHFRKEIKFLFRQSKTQIKSTKNLIFIQLPGQRIQLDARSWTWFCFYS